MMIKPGISELSKKVDSRYTLVSMAAKRGRMLASNAQSEDQKPISKAVEEIADGKVQYCRGEEAFEVANAAFGGDMIYAQSEPSTDLNLEALQYELQVANEERMEKERKEREQAEVETEE